MSWYGSSQIEQGLPSSNVLVWFIPYRTRVSHQCLTILHPLPQIEQAPPPPNVLVWYTPNRTRASPISWYGSPGLGMFTRQINKLEWINIIFLRHEKDRRPQEVMQPLFCCHVDLTGPMLWLLCLDYIRQGTSLLICWRARTPFPGTRLCVRAHQKCQHFHKCKNHTFGRG